MDKGLQIVLLVIFSVMATIITGLVILLKYKKNLEQKLISELQEHKRKISNLELILKAKEEELKTKYKTQHISKNYQFEYSKIEHEYEEITANYYVKKNSLMTKAEKHVYYKIWQALKDTNLIVLPQINMATIVDKTNAKYRNELFRNIDYGIFDKKTLEPLCMIELNDKTHTEPERIARDLCVGKILSMANIPLITLFTYNKNEPIEIRERILNCTYPKN